MALVLKEAAVSRLLDMDEVIAAVESAMRDLGSGTAQNEPRRRVQFSGGRLNVMFASWPSAGVSGVKSYSVGGSGVHFLVLLYGDDGSLQAILEADTLGAYRTGAATGVALKNLYRGKRPVVAILGAGHQAHTQVLAISRVTEIERLRVFSPTPDRREGFASMVSKQLGVHIDACSSAEDAVREADVVVCITTSREPVLSAEWVREGAVVVGAGSNDLRRVELPAELFADAAVVVDQLATARLESGDLNAAEVAGTFTWDRAVELGQVVAAKASIAHARATVFESHGLALWDIDAASTVLNRARAAGIGEELALFA